MSTTQPSESLQKPEAVGNTKPFWKTRKAKILFAVVAVLLVLVVVFVVIAANKKSTATPTPTPTPALTADQQCALLGAYWDATTSQCFAEPPPQVTQMTPQQSCEQSGGFWSNSNAQCLSQAPATPVIVPTTSTSGGGGGGGADPRIACLQGGGTWNETTNACVAPPTQVQTPPPIVPGPVVGQFVRIERVSNSGSTSPDGNVINLGELAVYGPNNQSLLPGATITAGSTYGGMYPPKNLLDNDIYTFAHTDPGGSPYTNIWIELNLGTSKEISQVVITNRQDCCQERAIGLRLVVKNASGGIVYASPAISTIENVYTFNTIV